MNVRNILIQEKKQVRLNEKGEEETPQKKINTYCSFLEGLGDIFVRK